MTISTCREGRPLHKLPEEVGLPNFQVSALTSQVFKLHFVLLVKQEEDQVCMN